MSEAVKHVFRSVVSEEMPLLEDRIGCLREARRVLNDVRTALLILLWKTLTTCSDLRAASLRASKKPTIQQPHW